MLISSVFIRLYRNSNYQNNTNLLPCPINNMTDSDPPDIDRTNLCVWNPHSVYWHIRPIRPPSGPISDTPSAPIDIVRPPAPRVVPKDEEVIVGSPPRRKTSGAHPALLGSTLLFNQWKWWTAIQMGLMGPSKRDGTNSKSWYFFRFDLMVQLFGHWAP